MVHNQQQIIANGMYMYNKFICQQNQLHASLNSFFFNPFRTHTDCDFVII